MNVYLEIDGFDYTNQLRGFSTISGNTTKRRPVGKIAGHGGAEIGLLRNNLNLKNEIPGLGINTEIELGVRQNNNKYIIQKSFFGGLGLENGKDMKPIVMMSGEDYLRRIATVNYLTFLKNVSYNAPTDFMIRRVLQNIGIPLSRLDRFDPGLTAINGQRMTNMAAFGEARDLKTAYQIINELIKAEMGNVYITRNNKFRMENRQARGLYKRGSWKYRLVETKKRPSDIHYGSIKTVGKNKDDIVNSFRASTFSEVLIKDETIRNKFYKTYQESPFLIEPYQTKLRTIPANDPANPYATYKRVHIWKIPIATSAEPDLSFLDPDTPPADPTSRFSFVDNTNANANHLVSLSRYNDKHPMYLELYFTNNSDKVVYLQQILIYGDAFHEEGEDFEGTLWEDPDSIAEHGLFVSVYPSKIIQESHRSQLLDHLQFLVSIYGQPFNIFEVEIDITQSNIATISTAQTGDLIQLQSNNVHNGALFPAFIEGEKWFYERDGKLTLTLYCSDANEIAPWLVTGNSVFGINDIIGF